MVREAEENKRGNEGIMESKGREVINPETHLRNRQIDGDERAVDVAARLLRRLRVNQLHLPFLLTFYYES